MEIRRDRANDGNSAAKRIRLKSRIHSARNARMARDMLHSSRGVTLRKSPTRTDDHRAKPPPRESNTTPRATENDWTIPITASPETDAHRGRSATANASNTE